MLDGCVVFAIWFDSYNVSLIGKVKSWLCHLYLVVVCVPCWFQEYMPEPSEAVDAPL